MLVLFAVCFMMLLIDVCFMLLAAVMLAAAVNVAGCFVLLAMAVLAVLVMFVAPNKAMQCTIWRTRDPALVFAA
jgi:hypothetical protein